MKKEIQSKRKLRQYREAISVFRKWNEIKHIIKNRKSAFDINEYLLLKQFINFDE